MFALQFSPNRVWIGLFSLWLLLLSGLLHGLFGAPGIYQAISLQRLLNSKQLLLTRLESEIEQIEGENSALETNRVTQEREIRKTLGYAGQDEIIFDFASSQSAALRK